MTTAKLSEKAMNDDLLNRPARKALGEQINWLIKLRWLATVGMALGGYLGSTAFPILTDATPIYICAMVLLAANIIHYLLAKTLDPSPRTQTILAMVQIVSDLLILTASLHYSGGLMNPFVLFYIFHIIIATIMLPGIFSFAVGIIAIGLYGAMVIGEIQLPWFVHVQLQFSSPGTLWRNPVYALWSFVAFVVTVLLAQSLTRSIIVRMITKELEAARHYDVLMAVIDAMGEGLIFLTNNGQVDMANKQALRWLTDNVDDQSKNLLDRLPVNLARHINAMLANNMYTGSSSEKVSFHLSDAQSSYIEIKSCPVLAVNGKPLGHVIVGQDLTEHKKLEQDLLNRTEEITKINDVLRKSQLELAQREKLVAIGQMASGIAHEIGNPLASLSSVTQYLSRQLKDPQSREQLGLIQSQVERISAILTRLLGLARPASEECTWSNVNQVIDDTLALVQYDIRARSVTIRNEENTDLPTIWLKKQNLEQVLLNVLINALDALMADENNPNPFLEITRSVKEGKIEIMISDNGTGINAETQKHIFEPFFTTKEAGKGTGLGLYISRNLLDEIGGTISLESEVGRGTTFTVRFNADTVGHYQEKENENMQQQIV